MVISTLKHENVKTVKTALFFTFEDRDEASEMTATRRIGTIRPMAGTGGQEHCHRLVISEKRREESSPRCV